jgi:hypothetical protein
LDLEFSFWSFERLSEVDRFTLFLFLLEELMLSASPDVEKRLSSGGGDTPLLSEAFFRLALFNLSPENRWLSFPLLSEPSSLCNFDDEDLVVFGRCSDLASEFDSKSFRFDSCFGHFGMCSD